MDPVSNAGRRRPRMASSGRPGVVCLSCGLSQVVPQQKNGGPPMGHRCGACDGTGTCQNDHHNFFSALVGAGTGIFVDIEDPSPACGKGSVIAGKCSVCGGSGWQDD
jgi:hypothetical protein